MDDRAGRFEQVGRLAMRVEGAWWRGYYALPKTMKGAILLGKIRMKAVEAPERRAAFLSLMKEAVADILEERTGIRPRWNGEVPAPELEREIWKNPKRAD